MKRTIFVVDDQPSVLEMVALVLRSLGREWEVKSFSDPFAAFEAVKTKAPDAVLTDQAMPGMQGSELLELIRAISPTTLRLIMSGCVALSKLTLITSAHQYIAKPFDPSKLKDMILRTFAAQERMANQKLQSVVTSIRSIPSLPQAHHALLAELEDSQSPTDAIARLIANDPGLSVKVLQLANSALFGQGSLITSPVEAVSCLGTEIITAIVLSQSVFQHYEFLKKRDIDLARDWSHCWETACLAQRLCREKKLPIQTAEEAFLAGLLHEVGRFILIDNFPEKYSAACEEAGQSKTPLVVCLRNSVQTGPAQLTGYVLELWGLPVNVTKAIGSLENPEADATAGFLLPAALYIADHLASRAFPPDPFPVEDWKAGYLEAIGCADEVSHWEKLAGHAEAGAHR